MEAAQRKIDELHIKQLDETRKLALECNLKKGEIYAARSKLIKEKGPKDFWFKVFSGHPDFAAELLGEYDANIFKALESFEVKHKTNGFKIEFTFGPNEYFTNTTLWYEETEEPGKSVVPTTSGVAWKEGKGPLPEEAEFTEVKKETNPWLAAAAKAEAQKESGARREREVEGRGFSFFSLFEDVPPEPKLNEDGAEDDGFDDEGFGDFDRNADELDAWDNIIDERREIARCICDEIWDNPAQYIQQPQN
jgi:hypothetical protein